MAGSLLLSATGGTLLTGGNGATLTAADIISRVRAQLMDLGTYAAYRWTDQELLQWVSDAQRAIVLTAPRTSQVTGTVQLYAGTKQTIPTDGWMLLTVYNNMGIGGFAPGNALVETTRDNLDNQYPNWHDLPQVVSPTAWVFDPSDPGTWWCYGPADGTGSARISYSKQPHEFTSVDDLMDVLDIYAGGVFDYVMYRALQKDSDYSGGQQSAQQYISSFGSLMQSLNKDPMTVSTQKGQT